MKHFKYNILTCLIVFILFSCDTKQNSNLTLPIKIQGIHIIASEVDNCYQYFIYVNSEIDLITGMEKDFIFKYFSYLKQTDIITSYASSEKNNSQKYVYFTISYKNKLYQLIWNLRTDEIKYGGIPKN